MNVSMANQNNRIVQADGRGFEFRMNKRCN